MFTIEVNKKSNRIENIEESFKAHRNKNRIFFSHYLPKLLFNDKFN